jgi:hypothetical protein
MAPHQVEDASDWEHDGQIIRQLKTPQTLTAWGATNCKLIVVQPVKRGGYVASPLMGQAMKEARKRGVPIEEHQVGWG